MGGQLRIPVSLAPVGPLVSIGAIVAAKLYENDSEEHNGDADNHGLSAHVELSVPAAEKFSPNKRLGSWRLGRLPYIEAGSFGQARAFFGVLYMAAPGANDEPWSATLLKAFPALLIR